MGFVHRDYHAPEGSDPPVYIIPAAAVTPDFRPPTSTHELPPATFVLFTVH